MLFALRILFVLAAMAAAGASSAWAQMDTARILTMTGQVSVEHGGELWVLTAGQAIASGQIVVTGPDGYSQLELPDHSIIEIFANSRVIFRPTASNWKDLVDIYLGKIRLQIQHLTKGDSPYRVNSPTAVISIRGTVLDVEVGPTEDTTVHVETGVVAVRHRLLPGREVLVETGQILRVSPNVPLAALKGTSSLVIAGRVARIAGETAIRIANTGVQSGGGGGGSTPRPSSGGGGSTSSSSSGSSAGANQPKAPPSGGGSAPPGDVVKPGGGASAPPGDVIKP